MILVILVIALAMLFGGIFIVANGRYNVECIGCALIIIGGVITFIAAIVILVLSILSSGASVVDEKIIMYQEENTKIEEQIAAIVSQYQEHEAEVFNNVKVAGESAITLVSLYPELKSDELVKSQIDIYVANNEMIKELRNEQINRKMYNWWLYFGGE